MNDGLIVKKSFDFAVSILTNGEYLNEKRKFNIENQLQKSGTSIGANVFEAQHAESRSDFIHKMKIALKEANETLYWLLLCEKIKGLVVEPEILNELNSIKLIISKIIITSKRNLT